MTPARLHLVPDSQAFPDLPAASHDLPDLLNGRPCDPRRFRDLYPRRWSEFLNAHFHNATHVSAFFDVDHHASRNWLEGKTGPQGWAVEYAIRSLPGAAEYLRGKQ